jgi:hypothetical protein
MDFGGDKFSHSRDLLRNKLETYQASLDTLSKPRAAAFPAIRTTAAKLFFSLVR